MSGLAKKHQKLSRKFISLVFVGCLLFVQIIVPVASVNAIQANPSDQLERWLYYRGMRACFYNPWFGVDVSDDESISASDINNGKLSIKSFEGISTQQKKGFGYLAPGMDGGDDNDGTVNCTDGSIFVRGAKLFGFDNPMKLICAMNRALGSGEGSRIKPSDPIDCERSEKIEFDGGGGDVFQRALTKALESEGSKDRPAFDINNNNGPDYSYKSLLYLIGKRSLEVFCGSNKTIESTGTGSGNVSNKDIVSIDIVKSDGTIDKSKNYPLGNPDRDEDSLVDDIYYDQGGDANNAKDLRCHEMAKMTRDNSADYKTWVKKHPEDAKKNENTAAAAGNSSSSSTDEKTSCAIDGLGWIICPVMKFLGGLNDQAYRFIDNFLEVPAKIFTNDAAKSAWEAFRNMANAAFIIAFLLIIYAQITGGSLGTSNMFSNYGIKRLLPRVIIAAILVNLSFIICSIAVDLSNILGSSLYNFMHGMNVGTNGEGANTGVEKLWESAAAGIIGIAAGVALLALIVFAPMSLLAFALAMIILIARQAFVILLIVVSPLAFVAYLLPNTEDWFKKWRKAFTTMLLVYPIVALVFGASSLASEILMNVASQGEDDANMMKIIALAVMAVPLFALPTLIKGSLSAAGTIGTKLAGLQDKTNKYGMSKVRDSRLGEAKTAFDAGRQKRRVERRVGDGRIGRINRAIDRSRFGRAIGGDRGAARAVVEKQKLDGEAVENSISLLEDAPPSEVIGRAQQQLRRAHETGDAVAARAATKVLAQRTGSRGIDTLHETLRSIEATGGLHTGIDESVRYEVNSASLKGKDRSLDKWSRREPDAGGKEMTLEDHDTSTLTPGGLNEAELAGQSLKQLRNFAKSSKIDAKHAERVLDAHSSGNVHLDPDKLEAFEVAAGKKPMPSGW